MTDTVNYEIIIEHIDDNGSRDIVDHDYFPIGQEERILKEFLSIKESGKEADLCVVRESGNNEDGLKERGYAYLYDDGGWQRPERFDDGNPIPKYIYEQIDKILKAVNYESNRLNK